MTAEERKALILRLLAEDEREPGTAQRISDKYGEALKISQVMKLLNCGRVKVKLLLEDGTLQYCMAGQRVSTASVAAYIDAGQSEIDHQRRMRKKYPYRAV